MQLLARAEDVVRLEVWANQGEESTWVGLAVLPEQSKSSGSFDSYV